MGRLVVGGVSKIYDGAAGGAPVVAVDDVSFTVENGEFCAILGHSGCGKTTLLNMVAGFEVPTGGHLTVDGAPIRGPGWERAIIFQDYALFPWLTVAGNVGFGLAMKKTAPEEQSRVIRHHIDLVGLNGFAHHYPHQLSGGMRQRVAIARALSVSPRVLLMDEPFAALDDQNRRTMQDELVRIWRREPKTVLLVTHSLDEAILLADHIIVMTRRPGRIKRRIPVDLPRPRDEDDPGYIALRKTLRGLIREDAEP
jgi:NitT/TauT family transport system ATP-binding protein